MKGYKRSTIFKTHLAYHIPIFFAMIVCFMTIPLSGEKFNPNKNAIIAIGIMAFIVIMIAAIIYLSYSALRYIILHSEYIEFRGALPPVRAKRYHYTAIERCIFDNIRSGVIMTIYTRDGKRRNEHIAMVRESTLREIADELMSYGVVIESNIMRRFRSAQPLRYYTIMIWLIGALTIGYIAAFIYKGKFSTQGLGGYLVAIGVILPMRGVAYTYVAMDSEALYITNTEPNPLASDRILLDNIERVEIRKMKWNELGRYSITIKQRCSLLIETKSLGRVGEEEAATLAEALRAVGIKVAEPIG